jgi:hypothetical protein
MKKGGWGVSNKRRLQFFVIRVLLGAVMRYETRLFSSFILPPSSLPFISSSFK